MPEEEAVEEADETPQPQHISSPCAFCFQTGLIVSVDEDTWEESAIECSECNGTGTL